MAFQRGTTTPGPRGIGELRPSEFAFPKVCQNFQAIVCDADVGSEAVNHCNGTEERESHQDDRYPIPTAIAAAK